MSLKGNSAEQVKKNNDFQKVGIFFLKKKDKKLSTKSTKQGREDKNMMVKKGNQTCMSQLVNRQLREDEEINVVTLGTVVFFQTDYMGSF